MTFNDDFQDLYSKAKPIDPELGEEIPMFELGSTDPEEALPENPS